MDERSKTDQQLEKNMSKLFTIFITILIISGAYTYATLPNVSVMETCFKTSMFGVDLCPKSSKYAKLSQISPNIKNAVIISEDVGFYSHNGFDTEELKNSFIKNIKKMSFARGGSTISQQLAKNLFLSPEKTPTRKLKEFVLTKRIEDKYSKDFILEKYLNVVEFGKGLYGIKAATEYYFQKPPSMITPLEAAFLAFLLPNPDKYSVSFKKKELTPFAKSRIKDILFKLSHYKKIQNSEYLDAKSQLQTMFVTIPEMEGEADDQEYYTGSTEYDMADLQNKQNESINKLETLEETPPDSLETVYPDEIPTDTPPTENTYEVQ